MLRTLMWSAPVALLASAYFSADIAYTGFVIAALLLLLLALGAKIGWRALGGFAAAYWVASVAAVALWSDDPRTTGLDDPNPIMLFILTTPVLLVPIALGASARTLMDRRLRSRVAA